MTSQYATYMYVICQKHTTKVIANLYSEYHQYDYVKSTIYHDPDTHSEGISNIAQSWRGSFYYDRIKK